MFCMRIADATEHTSLLVIKHNKLYVTKDLMLQNDCRTLPSFFVSTKILSTYVQHRKDTVSVDSLTLSTGFSLEGTGLNLGMKKVMKNSR